MATARLTADLTANTSKFETGMKRASKTMQGFGDAVAKATKAAGVAIGGMGLALGALTVKQMGAIDATAKLSASLGVGIREFQAISLVAKEAGVDQGKLAMAFTRTQRAIFDAANGSKSGQQAFKSLGLSAKELINLSPDQQFNKIAGALGEVKNATERAALAQQIFGKGGREIINMLGEYNKKVDDARAFNDKFNISLSEVDAAKVEEANDTMGRVGEAIKGLGNTLAVQFSPLVTAAGQALLDAGVDGTTFGKAVKGGISIAAGAIDILRSGIIGIRFIFLEVSLAIDKVVAFAFRQLSSLANAAAKMPLIGNSVKGLAESFNFLADGADISVENTKKSIAALQKEADEFVLTSDKIAKIQLEAQQRAKQNVDKRPSISGIADIAGSVGKAKKEKAKTDEFAALLSGMQKENDMLGIQIRMYGQKATAIEKAQKLAEIENTLKEKNISLTETQRGQLEQCLDNIEKQKNALEELGNKSNFLTSSVDQIAEAFKNGEKASAAFKKVAINALSEIAKTAISSFGRAIDGGGGGGILGSLFGAVSSGIGSFFGSFLPSFDVGSYNVPSDMVANIHKGEMIVPAKEAAQIRAGGSGGGVTVMQTINIGENVSMAVRQEVSKMMPDIKRATVSAVEDSRLRGAMI